MAKELTHEQLSVLNSTAKNLIVSASAGSGKTYIMIKYITNLVKTFHIPVKRLLVLTFTRAAAGEMRERLLKSLLECKADSFMLEQIDDLSTSDISTIDAFCEKLVRRNLEKLDIDEGVRIAEDTSIVMANAFDKALASLDEKYLSEIYYSFRKNKSEIYEAVSKLHAFFTSMKDGKQKLAYFINNQSEIFDKASDFLNKRLKNKISSFRQSLAKQKDNFISQPKYQELCDNLLQSLNLDLGDSFEENVKKVLLIKLPSVPTVAGKARDEELATLAKSMRKEIKDYFDSFAKYNFALSDIERIGSLSVSLLKLYECFSEKYAQAKRALDILDFVDIENYALSLIETPQILEDLQTKYDYVFVDEYQDTNRVQEAIIKPLTKDGHFVAVGDPKQGIYGFRNATMEIMQSDTQQFESMEDGEAIYLRGNFRSDNRLLSFVNTVFEKIMTTESVGIDYAKTSMLSGKVDFKKMALPSVRVDIVKPQKQEAEQLEPKIYHVKEAPLVIEEKKELEVETIIARIDELLTQQIYDAKLEKYRRVEEDDIVVLFRRRNTVMNELDKKLKARGISVVSDLKEVETQQPQVKMLVGLLKLLINRNDDISLCAVMLSRIGGFSPDELASLRIENPKAKSFYELLTSSLNPKVDKFFSQLDALKMQCQLIGASKALNNLFLQNNYFAYLSKLNDGSREAVENFLKDIKAYDFNLSEAINFFTKVGGRKRGNGTSGNAIRLMSVHASKGLEFPIVILAGAGDSLEKVNKKCYAINGHYGLATHLFDEKQNVKYPSIVFDAANISNSIKQFIDELMIFYVALTRAQNHLYIVGSKDIDTFNARDIYDVKNYLSLIMFAYENKFVNKLKVDGCVVAGDVEFNYVTQVQNLQLDTYNKVSNFEIDEKMRENLRKYLDFEYTNQNYCKVNIKNSVTSLNKDEQQYHEKIAENSLINYVDIGNAYHEALKLLDFNKVVDLNSLNSELNLLKLTEGYRDLIDENILLKNILKIKEIIGDQKIIKEKQFLMKIKLNEIEDCDLEDEVLVQGIIDLFTLGENNILIDYKFTQEKNPQKILEKYKKQLKLYTIALEKGFNIKINKKYLLSLKSTDLIEFSN